MAQQHVWDGETFERLQCGQCGIAFYAPSFWVEVRRDRGDHGKEFHCPNGHTRVWRVPEIDKIRQERDHLKQQAARLEDERREANERADREAKKAARIKRRAEAALCPCCNRHFTQIERHMKLKHPNVVSLKKQINQ